MASSGLDGRGEPMCYLDTEDDEENIEPPLDAPGMSPEDRRLDIERLREKWEDTPAALVPYEVKRRLLQELSVDLELKDFLTSSGDWNVNFWSRRKRRRTQTKARAAVDEEKIVIALKTLCSEREWVGALLGWVSR